MVFLHSLLTFTIWWRLPESYQKIQPNLVNFDNLLLVDGKCWRLVQNVSLLVEVAPTHRLIELETLCNRREHSPLSAGQGAPAPEYSWNSEGMMLQELRLTYLDLLGADLCYQSFCIFITKIFESCRLFCVY